ncbi:CLASP1_2 [Mytilus coruscus]|uniref:CLASP1_2 n=1 Tax=Mytilus coruscus TaxID=42192 RepID=A0A6J8B9C7_MYTCO|nr:CLASP1_2 [Mytilus coruscus]
MATLDDFTLGITTSDTRKRVQTHSDLVSHLRDPYSSIHCIDIDELIGGLVAWVNCSNYKISINGLEVLCLMVDRMGEDFKPHISSVMVAVVDRLGDSKDQVRDQAQQLLLKLMMPGSSPQFVFERLMGAFNHKLWHVREGVLICLQNTLNLYGARCLSLNKIVPSICKLIEDQNSQVRDEAVNTLCEIYRHVGEKVRQDMAKKGIPPQKLTQIYQRFDEVKASGNMLATADFEGSLYPDEMTFSGLQEGVVTRIFAVKIYHLLITSLQNHRACYLSDGTLGTDSNNDIKWHNLSLMEHSTDKDYAIHVYYTHNDIL